MSGKRRDKQQPGSLDPQALRLADAARVLTAVGPNPVTVDMIEEDIDAGAPTNANGTLNLVHFAAWLVKEMAHGG